MDLITVLVTTLLSPAICVPSFTQGIQPTAYRERIPDQLQESAVHGRNSRRGKGEKHRPRMGAVQIRREEMKLCKSLCAMIKGLKMKPCNPFCATTKDLVEYSDLVTSILASPCIPSSIGSIEEDPSYKRPQGVDCLAYWDKVSVDICYGRFLLCKKTNTKDIKFWFGLSSTPWLANLIIWFNKKEINAVNTDYINTLRKIFELQNRYYESSDEVWITMEDKNFDKFCNNSSSRKDIIIDFWQSVLGELNKKAA